MNKLLSDDDLLQLSYSTKPVVVATTWQKTKRNNNSKRVVLFAIVFALRDMRDEDEGLVYL